MLRSVIRPVLLALIALAAPAAARAQTAPVPLSPETWPRNTEWLCDWHACDEGGSVRFALAVTPEGRVRTCEILESSGNMRLDENTCRLLIRYARFAPARAKRGRAVAGRYVQWMHWKVPEAPASPEAGVQADRH